MPFALKNVGATYQKLVTQVFKEKLGWNMEVYIDDMIVKTKVAAWPLLQPKRNFR